jgi:putative transposase
MEQLNLKNMTKSAKGTIAQPGTNVKQKSGLNRELQRQGHGTLRRKIEQKVLKFGGTFVPVDPKHTSQRCHACGTIDSASRKNQSRFECTNCGKKINADSNAAINILHRGTGVWKKAA